MTASAKKEALENALKHYRFDKMYFIYSINKGTNTRFTIASNSGTGGINTHTRFMSYDEMNAYFFGYNDAKLNTYSTKL
jgi:hypothetical protein